MRRRRGGGEAAEPPLCRKASRALVHGSLSVARQQVVPVRSFEIGRVALEDGDGSSDTKPHADTAEYILEPNQQDFLGSLLPHFIFFKVFHFLLEARASEHSARMVAMKSATDNAKQLIKDLTLEYNKVRQASITTEILEIATAQMILS